VLRAIATARKYSPEAMALCAKIMRDQEMSIQNRLKAAEVTILDRAVSRQSNSAGAQISDSAIQSLHIGLVDPETKVAKDRGGNLRGNVCLSE
jgi:hypothetical protein